MSTDQDVEYQRCAAPRGAAREVDQPDPALPQSTRRPIAVSPKGSQLTALHRRRQDLRMQVGRGVPLVMWTGQSAYGMRRA
jgi:hypothetical protein